MTRICIVGTDNLAILDPQYKDIYFGGEAVQQAILARAFRDYGFEVCVLANDFGQPREYVIDDITIISTFATSDGLPVVRFVYPRLIRLYSALNCASADVYLQSCAGVNTGYTAHYCKRNKKKFIFRTASDTDVIPGRHRIPNWHGTKIYEYGLKNADIVSVQTRYQNELLAVNYGRRGHVVPMAWRRPKQDLDTKKDIDVLWVSNIRECKRPDVFTEIAQQMPDINFLMIGGEMLGEEALYAQTKVKCQTLPNLEFLGAVDFDKVGNFFARSKIFLNTSDVEGFPNTFLQAWSHGLPVLSFFDPDDMIKRLSLGVCPASVSEMTSSINSLLQGRGQLKFLSEHVSDYASDNFAEQAVVREYVNLLDDLES